MKINVKKGQEPERNDNDELDKVQNMEELQTAEKTNTVETDEEIKVKEKYKNIDDLLDHFEKRAADSPDLIKDKDSYFNSKEFNELSDSNFDFNKKRRAELEGRIVHLEDVYEQENKKKKNTIPWRNYLVYLMIITSLSCCVTFSKYITEVNGSGIGTVAGFDFQTDIPGMKVGTNEVGFGGLMSGEEDVVYTVTVQNNSGVSVKAKATLTGDTTHARIELSPTGTDNLKEVEGTFAPNSDPITFYVIVSAPADGVTETAYFTVYSEQID